MQEKLQASELLPVVGACCSGSGARDTQAHELAGLTLRLARSMSLLERDRVCCEDVTVQQCFTLSLLRDEDQKTMQEMAEALGLAVSTVTRNVDVLERRGAVVRERDSQDGRVVRVRLTGEGRELADRLVDNEVDCCAQLLQLVPAQRRESLLVALSDLIRAAEQLRCGGGACCP